MAYVEPGVDLDLDHLRDCLRDHQLLTDHFDDDGRGGGGGGSSRGGGGGDSGGGSGGLLGLAPTTTWTLRPDGDSDLTASSRSSPLHEGLLAQGTQASFFFGGGGGEQRGKVCEGRHGCLAWRGGRKKTKKRRRRQQVLGTPPPEMPVSSSLRANRLIDLRVPDGRGAAGGHSAGGDSLELAKARAADDDDAAGSSPDGARWGTMRGQVFY
jgi:hypothetical protein